jgi:hypothetical protein
VHNDIVDHLPVLIPDLPPQVVLPQVQTRSGRVVKPRDRLDL